MAVVIDTDAFCKLAIAGLLEDAVRLLSADLGECSRLAALPFMLQKGRLRKKFGPEACDSILPIAAGVSVLIAPEAWLERLTAVQDIDPGEAQIFSAAAAQEAFVMTGDKRALRALKDIEGFPVALAGRIVVLEAILIALCHHRGAEDVRIRLQPLIPEDRMLDICFSSAGASPLEGLRSYFDSLITEVAPLVLWHPPSGASS